MAVKIADFFYMVKVFFLLNLFFSTSVQADISWEKQSSDHLAQLLKNNPEQLLELNELELIVFYRERKHKPLWLDARGRLNRAYDLLHVIIHAEDEDLEPFRMQFICTAHRTNICLTASFLGGKITIMTCSEVP